MEKQLTYDDVRKALRVFDKNNIHKKEEYKQKIDDYAERLWTEDVVCRTINKMYGLEK